MRQRLHAVRSFAYQLQGRDGADLELNPLIASDFDLFVIDYSRDGSEDGALGHEEIADLNAGGRVGLAYLSLGEAESYRYYWQQRWAPAGQPAEEAPPWLGPTNPAWEGNYKVRYWDEDWQRLIERYLDRIIDAGFDGVYLDIIDAYEFFGPDGEATEREDAAPLMALFVERIAKYDREQRPNFLVVPQNGPAILDALDREQGERYLATIDGIGAEDSFYFGPLDEDNPLDAQAEDAGAAGSLPARRDADARRGLSHRQGEGGRFLPPRPRPGHRAAARRARAGPAAPAALLTGGSRAHVDRGR